MNNSPALQTARNLNARIRALSGVIARECRSDFETSRTAEQQAARIASLKATRASLKAELQNA